MKTILLISRCPPFPLHFGDRLIVWHLARELSRRGHVIDLLAQYDRDEDRQQLAEYDALFRHIELFREPRRSALAQMRRVFGPASRFATNPEMSYCPALWRRIAAYRDRHDYDLAHCFGSVSVYEFHPLVADLPNLITPYESYALYLKSAARGGDFGARLRLPLARRFERFMFTPFERTVVVSSADRAMLRSLQPQLDVRVIPNGIDLQRFHARAASRDDDTLLFLGNFAYPPNQDAAKHLIQVVLPGVRDVMPAARLQLVGVNPPGWLRELANDHIEVTGAVPDVTPYLARATVFVCPLRFGAGLKNKVLEALAMGIPIVATPLSVDGIDVRHGESAFISPLAQFAESTIALLNDVPLRERMAKGGRALIESQYSWARAASSYEQLYDEICTR